jgi:2-aminoadipate transaminase
VDPGPPWTQGDRRPGIIDLGPGYPDPDLLPVDLMREAASEAIQRYGVEALSYGVNTGPAPLRAFVAAQVPGSTGVDVLSTAGTSSALSTLATRLAREGAAVLTESLTYDLAVRVFADRGVRTVAVPGPLHDIDTRQLRLAVDRASRVSGVPPALYVMPTFHNPTGRVLSRERRIEILEIAEGTGLRLIEDHAYSALGFDAAEVPEPLWSLAPGTRLVTTLVSLSKCLAPGLRVGGMVADRETLGRLSEDGERLSGGGPNHFTSAVVAHAAAEGLLEEHVARLREQLRERRDILVGELRTRLPDGYTVTQPSGGFFLWVGLPAQVDDRALLAEAERTGVSFAPGSRFGAGARGIRLCFASCGPQALAVAAGRLVRAAHTASRSTI